MDQGCGDGGGVMFENDVRIFASRFWGFSPETHPAVMFGKAGNRDRLLKLSRSTDLVLFVGTMGEPTISGEQGRLLGLAQFSRTPVETLALIDPEEIRPEHLNNGRYKWPKALAITQAWRFDTSLPLLTDVLKKQLTMYATVGVVQLDYVDTLAVLSLARTKISVKQLPAVENHVKIQRALQNNRPTTGPKAGSWSGEVTRDVSGLSETYAMRFGKSDIWKIGWALDASNRLLDLNKHVPIEYLNQEWTLAYRQRWNTGDEAREMEQRLLKKLDRFRTVGERLRCREVDLTSAWFDTIQNR